MGTAEFCLVDKRSACYIAYQGDRKFSFGFGLNDLADFDATKSRTSYNVVAGKTGSRVELKESAHVFLTI